MKTGNCRKIIHSSLTPNKSHMNIRWNGEVDNITKIALRYLIEENKINTEKINGTMKTASSFVSSNKELETPVRKTQMDFLVLKVFIEQNTADKI